MKNINKSYPDATMRIILQFLSWILCFRSVPDYINLIMLLNLFTGNAKCNLYSETGQKAVN